MGTAAECRRISRTDALRWCYHIVQNPRQSAVAIENEADQALIAVNYTGRSTFSDHAGS